MPRSYRQSFCALIFPASPRVLFCDGLRFMTIGATFLALFSYILAPYARVAEYSKNIEDELEHEMTSHFLATSPIVAGTVDTPGTADDDASDVSALGVASPNGSASLPWSLTAAVKLGSFGDDSKARRR